VSDLLLTLLRLIFLALVYLFVWQVARSIGAAPRAAAPPAQAQAGQPGGDREVRLARRARDLVEDSVVLGRSPRPTWCSTIPTLPSSTSV
jgi:hypothetical protein